jgi:hypothetical protein
VFSVAAVDLQDAWQKFRRSSVAATEIMFIVKAETEIYLAGEA